MKNMFLLLFFLPCISTSVLGQDGTEANTVVDIEDFKERRFQKLMERLIGTYHTSNGRLLTVGPSVDRLDIRYLNPQSDMVFGHDGHDMEFALENLVEHNKKSFMGRSTVVETNYKLFEDGFSKKVVSTNKWTQKKEVFFAEYRIGPDWVLRQKFSRLYYKRKYRAFGDWVLDQSSFNGRKNSIGPVEKAYTKLSADVVDLYAIADENRKNGAHSIYRIVANPDVEDPIEALRTARWEIDVPVAKAPEPLYTAEGDVLHLNPKRPVQETSNNLDFPEVQGDNVVSINRIALKTLSCKAMLN